MVRDSKFKFWIDNKYNVLFIGKHGVGKTARIKQAFDEAGLKWLYFSASTLDPWVDFIGIPKEVADENGTKYIDLIRPKPFAEDDVEAIFLDEFNRCLAGDTLIQLVDGNSIPIKDLVGKKEFYVYSYDLTTDRIVVGRGHSARKTIRNARIIKITLDSGIVIKCTEDHPFLLLGGEYKKADKLKENDSLMPLYKNYNISRNTKGYESVYFPKHNIWYYTHWLSDEYNVKYGIYSEESGRVCHHINFNKNNNSPENIVRMVADEHLKLHKETASKGGKAAHDQHPDLYHRTIGNDDVREIAIRNSILTRKTSSSYKKLRSAASRKMYTDDVRRYRSEVTKQQWLNGQFENIDRAESGEKMYLCKTINVLDEKLNGKLLTEEEYLKIRDGIRGRGNGILTLKKIREYFGSFDVFKEHYNKTHPQNHRVVSVEHTDIFEDVYDITVDEYENFALGAGVFVHNSPKKVRNAVMELIQFKSINGKKFNNLKFVWAAINPDDEKKGDDDAEEEDSYDVEKLDPAQKDRFEVHVEVPYKPDRNYFSDKYPTLASAAVSWWNDLNNKQKNLVSPRRLDYALHVYSNGGDVRDVLPAQVNVSKLITELKFGSYEKLLKSIFDAKDDEKTKEFLAVRNNYEACVDKIAKSEEYSAYFLRFMNEEDVVNLMGGNAKVYNAVVKNAENFRAAIDLILSRKQPKKLYNKIKKDVNVIKVVTSKIGGRACSISNVKLTSTKIDTMPRIPRNTPQWIKEFSSDITALLDSNYLKKDLKMGTQYRINIYHRLVDSYNNYSLGLTLDQYKKFLDLICSIIAQSHPSSVNGTAFKGMKITFGYLLKKCVVMSGWNAKQVIENVKIVGGNPSKVADFLNDNATSYV